MIVGAVKTVHVSSEKYADVKVEWLSNQTPVGVLFFVFIYLLL